MENTPTFEMANKLKAQQEQKNGLRAQAKDLDAGIAERENSPDI